LLKLFISNIIPYVYIIRRLLHNSIAVFVIFQMMVKYLLGRE